MKLRNSRFKKQKICRESISYDQLFRCITRFLKELGYYSAYMRSIKPCMCSLYLDKFGVVNKEPLNLKDFIRREVYATSRELFPGGGLWDEIYDLWMDWSYNEDNISSKTTIQ